MSAALGLSLRRDAPQGHAGVDDPEALAALDDARPALLARFAALAPRRDPAAAAIITALDPVLVLSTRPAEHRRLLEAALDLARDGDDPLVLADALRAFARFGSLHGAQRASLRLLDDALTLTPPGDATRRAATHALRAHALFSLGQHADAIDEADLARREARDSPFGTSLRITSYALQMRALATSRLGAPAVDLATEALDLARAAGAARTTALAIANLGFVHLSAQDAGPALSHLARARALFDRLGDEVHARRIDAAIALARPDPARIEALAALHETLDDHRAAALLRLALCEHLAPSRPADAARHLALARAHLALVDLPDADARADALDRRLATARAPRLVVHSSTHKALHGDHLVDLSRRPVLVRVLVALARARLDAPGQSLSTDALFRLAWPDERALPHAARARVHVALRTLRALGLASAIVTRDGGYRIDERTEVELR